MKRLLAVICAALAGLASCKPQATQGDGGSGSSSGGSQSSSSSGSSGAASCPEGARTCAQLFTYNDGAATSVNLHGSFTSPPWTTAIAMTEGSSGLWSATAPIAWAATVQYNFQVNGASTWIPDPANPDQVSNGVGGYNSQLANVTCKTWSCPGGSSGGSSGSTTVVPPGVFDWRDAVIYFVFVDRFFDGDPTNNCNVTGASTGQYTSANYLGGDWAGVTQKINEGYFKALGVNTLWISVPIQNADNVVGEGAACNNGSCTGDGYEYTAYHGYWPTDPTQVEPCFGTAADLETLVSTAHAAGLKILFDYAMVDIHTSSALYAQHVNDSPSWFTPYCLCGDTNDGCSDFDDYKCWFASYLAHFDFTNSTAARTYSVNATLGLIQSYGNDAFRLDAIKQVDPSWLASLRPQVTTYESQAADGGAVQHFYMVGETYDFDDMGQIASFINPNTGLDGQFDFPLRYRLVDTMLLRDTSAGLDYPIPSGGNWTYSQPAGMQGLAQFMDFNDTYYPQGTVMSTFIGNHDLPRSIHYAEQTIPAWLGANAQDADTTNGSDNAWTGEPGLETDPNTYERLANTFAVILTNKGAPLIYYGDEIGLPGAGDPDNRRMMTWSGLSPAQQGLQARISKLTAIRAGHPSMRRGTRTTLDVDADLWVFSESATDASGVTDTVYVGINRNDSDRTTTAIPAGLPELVVGGGSSTGNDTIPARETRVFSSYGGGSPDGG